MMTPPFKETSESEVTEKSLFGEEIVSLPVQSDSDDARFLSDALLSPPSDEPSQPLLALASVALDSPAVVGVQSVRKLLPYIDELNLFEKQWGYDKGAASRDEWCAWAKAEVVPVFENLIDYCDKNAVFDLRASYVYVEAVKEDETLLFYTADGKTPFYSHTFKRFANGRCVTDAFGAAQNGAKDTAALMIVTCGKRAQEVARKWKINGHETDCAYLNGLAKECVEAVQRYVSAQINKCGACVGDTVTLGDKETDLRLMRPLLNVCDAAQIDVAYNKVDILVPEYAKAYLVCPR